MDSVKLWNPKPESRKDTFDSSMDDFGQMKDTSKPSENGRMHS